MTRSVPLDKCWGDAMLAYAQNGEALRPEQGHPLRLLLRAGRGIPTSSGCAASK